jgi:hypothetical protein
MEAEVYKGYAIWGHAILEHGDILQPKRYAGSGTITKGSKFIEASGVLGMGSDNCLGRSLTLVLAGGEES